MKTFETCQIELQNRSAHYFLNKIADITPPEFLILQDLHGAHAVKFLKKTEPARLTRQTHAGKWQTRPITSAELIEKLRLKYGELRVKAVFPGANPVLPFDFDTIGVSEENNGSVLSEQAQEDNESLWEDMPQDEVKAERQNKAAKGKKADPLDDVKADPLKDVV